MIKVSDNENGFSILEVLAITVIVVLIGTVGWLVYRNNHKTTTTNNGLSIIVGPVLGTKWNSSPDLKGYGTVLPKEVFNGGDPTGLVQNITWQSWGGTTAIGHGTAEYVTANENPVTGKQANATIETFNLDVCNGKSSYNAVEWYFP